jgi:hypothetical protein
MQQGFTNALSVDGGIVQVNDRLTGLVLAFLIAKSIPFLQMKRSFLKYENHAGGPYY